MSKTLSAATDVADTKIRNNCSWKRLWNKSFTPLISVAGARKAPARQPVRDFRAPVKDRLRILRIRPRQTNSQPHIAFATLRKISGPLAIILFRLGRGLYGRRSRPAVSGNKRVAGDRRFRVGAALDL